MSITSLKNLLDEAKTNNTYVIGFVVQGWEDACSFVEAAQETDSGIILQSGPGLRKNMPLEVIYSMFEKLGKEANVKVVPHLDHGENHDICQTWVVLSTPRAVVWCKMISAAFRSCS